MSAASIIQTLLSIGTAIESDIAGAGGAVNAQAALKNVLSDATIGPNVAQLVLDLKNSDMGAALTELQAKEVALLKGKAPPQLSDEDKLTYDDLVDARNLLAAAQVKRSMDGTLAEWLINDALPVLKSLLTTLVPLL